MKKIFIYFLLAYVAWGCITEKDRQELKIKDYYDLSAQYYKMSTRALQDKEIAKGDSLRVLADKYYNTADSLYAEFIKP